MRFIKSIISFFAVSIILIPYSLNAQSFTLNVSKSGIGGSTITSSPPGINCAPECTSDSAQYKDNLRVTLRVKTDLYSTFLGWGGDCQAQGTKPSCTVRMDSDKEVVASFGLPEMSISPTGYDFENIGLKQSSTPVPLAIHNNGTGNLEIDSIKILGTDKKMFKISGNKSTVIPPGDDYEYTIIFRPITTGLKNAVFEITSNDPNASVIEVPVSGFGCTYRTDQPRVRKCRGTLAQCLSMQCEWKLDAKAISDPHFCDASVLRLPDGRYRMYGNYDTARGLIDSWISQDGIVFEKEPGSRLTGFGIIWPSVVILPDGRFRMYYTDQSNPTGSGGAISIKSAISTDGLNFIVEDGQRLTYLGSGYESEGIIRPKVILLGNDTYRMYYSAIGNDVNRVMSAISSDGLNWVREQGIRIDPQNFCPANTRVMDPGDSYIDSNGVIHQYIWTVKCKNRYYQGAVAGLFEFTSVDGVTFSIGATPIISGYYFQECYTGKPDDPGMRTDNAPVVMTPDGLRAYLFTYNPQSQCAAWTGGYYSILNPSLR
jgi:hypothetical protein